MNREHREKQAGFSLIEMMIVTSIVAVLAAVAVFTYLSSINDVRLRGDVRAINQSMQFAKLRAISTGLVHGVAFERRANAPDRFFIYMNCTGGDEYNDNDNNVATSVAVRSRDACMLLNYDPIVEEFAVSELSANNNFGLIFGRTSPPPGATLDYISFNPVSGGAGPFNLIQLDDSVIIESVNPQSGEMSWAAVTVIPLTGITQVEPIRRAAGNFN